MNDEENFKDRYLWDRSGEPEPEIQRLESLLGRLRHDPVRNPAPLWVEIESAQSPWRRWIAFPRLVPALAVLAMVIIAAILVRRSSPPGPSGTSQSSWEVSRLAGTPRIGTSEISGTAQLAVGQLLETDSDSRARVAVAKIGEVEVEPSTRLRLLASKPTEDRLGLDRGTIHAFISAPPRLFFVNTPAAVATDLGCAYTLHVDENGVGLLRVTFGWVEFESHGQQSLIPAGAAAITRPGADPGTPYFEDATDSFKSALEELDFESMSPADRESTLRTLLAQARKRDGFTMLYLLRPYHGMSDAERGLIFDRLAELIPPPTGVDRGSIMRGDDYMIGLWWDLMGVGHPRKK